jgi:tetratricopeptide (TPR) repeat protein
MTDDKGAARTARGGRRVFLDVRWSAALLFTSLILSVRHSAAQESVPLSATCFDLNRTVVSQVQNGRLGEAEITMSAALKKDPEPLCEGVLLTNLAALVAIQGRHAEAERLAERSLRILEKYLMPEDPVLLKTLQILAAARFQQGKTAKAREAFQRMQMLQIRRPQDAALVHGVAAALLEAEGRRSEAESEYLAALRAWADSGRGDTVDAGTILSGLASFYVYGNRLDDARRALNRALAIFERAKDTVPMDRIKLLSIQAGLNCRLGEWRKAEEYLREAVAIADSEPLIAPSDNVVLLASYARVLRKNHNGREAHSIEVRLAALRRDNAAGTVVDVTELLPKPKPSKR